MTWRRIVLGTTLLAAVIPFLLTGCSGGGSSSSTSSLNLAGAWTATTLSTQGQGKFSGTATVSQSGQGLGVNGTTTLAAAIGQIVVSQSGTALTGTITNAMKATSFNFTGTLSSGNLSLTGSSSCPGGATQTTSITGTIASNSIQGSYTITRSAKCYAANEAGTFTATKQ